MLQVKHTAGTPIVGERNPDVKIRPVSYSNVDDARNFCNEAQIKAFGDFLKKGYKGYFAYLDNICVGRLWLFTDSEKTFINDIVRYKLKEHELYTAWGETDGNYRRKGIFHALMSYILENNKNCDVFSTIIPDNNVSMSAHRRIGFEICRKYTIVTIWRLRVSFIHEYSGFFRFKIRIGNYV